MKRIWKKIGLACAAGALWLLAAPGCPKHTSGDIDVDAVQGCVGRIESELRAMRAALRAKDLEAAAKAYAEAREEFDDNRALLSAYPELGELSSSLEESASRLCYDSVSVLLERYFETTRAGELRDAERRLQEAQEQFGRCESIIAQRDDFTALKVNLDTAPQALAGLRHRLERPARLERIQAERAELEPRLEALRRGMAELEKKPREADRRAQLDKERLALREALAVRGDFTEEPEWKAFFESAARELAAVEGRLASAVRMARARELSEDVLPMAIRQAALAAAQRDPQAASRLVEPVVDAYRRCRDTLAEILREEPALAKASVALQGRERNLEWLSRHCASEHKRAEKLLQRLTGKKAPPAAPKVEADDPSAAPAPAKNPPPKSKKRRVRRW